MSSCENNLFVGILGSRHSSYTSHQSRISYTSHGDLLGTKEHKLKNRQPRSTAMVPFSGAGAGAAGGGGGAAGFSDSGHHKGHRSDCVSYIYSMLLAVVCVARRCENRNFSHCIILSLLLCYWPCAQDGSMDCTDEAGKVKHQHDNPFIEPVHGQKVVDMKGS